MSGGELTERPLNNYKPSHWSHEDLIKGEAYSTRAAALHDGVSHLLSNLYVGTDPIASLELIEDIQRLGLGYIFQKEIQSILNSLVERKVETGDSLYATSLYFRLLRLNGFIVSQDVFRYFQDQNGCFKEHLAQDFKGLLNLYEASYIATEGEDILDVAKVFARKHLANVKQDTGTIFYDQVNRALGLPLHFNITRLEARWYIDAYSKRNDANLDLLKYAKLDFNMLQGAYQEELIVISTWWESLGVRETLPFFTRDNLVEAYTWAIGMNDEPQHKYFREAMTKLLCFVTILDDVYDNYATLEEAQLFTDAVERWDINELEQLPGYMRVLFFAFYNTINEFAYKAMKEQGMNTLPYLKKKNLELLQVYMIQLKWFKTGYKQSLKEYLDTADASSTTTILYLSSYVFMSPNITLETLDYIDKTPDIIHWSAYILRMLDDLGTCREEAERGDNMKAVECHMNDEGVSEEVARLYIIKLIEESWRKFNAAMLTESTLPQTLIKLILDDNRTTHVFYQYGDGYGHPGREMKERISAIIFNSIPM